MRTREHVLDSLEKLYREELNRTADVGTSRLEFDFQRDQLYVEMLLDIRDLLKMEKQPAGKGSSLLDKAQKIRQVTRLGK